MKDFLLVIAIGLAAIFIILYITNWRDIRNLNDENKLLQDKIDGQQIIIKEKTDDYIALKTEVEADRRELDKAIEAANKAITHREEEIVIQDEKIKELREAQKSITNKDELIGNLKEQIFRLDKKIVNLESMIREKDSIIFSLTEKYEAEHNLRLAAEKILDDYVIQVSDQAKLIKNLEQQLAQKKRTNFWVMLGSNVGSFLLGSAFGK